MSSPFFEKPYPSRIGFFVLGKFCKGTVFCRSLITIEGRRLSFENPVQWHSVFCFIMVLNLLECLTIHNINFVLNSDFRINIMMIMSFVCKYLAYSKILDLDIFTFFEINP